MSSTQHAGAEVKNLTAQLANIISATTSKRDELGDRLIPSGIGHIVLEMRRHSATTVSPFFFFSVIRQQRILGSRSANPSGSSIVPVRAGIVRRAWTYQWSSASFHTGRSHWDPLVKDQKLRGLARDWEDFLMRTPKTKDKTTRKMTRTGRPTGDFDFLSLVEQFKIFTFSQEETNERDIRRHFHPEAR